MAFLIDKAPDNSLVIIRSLRINSDWSRCSHLVIGLIGRRRGYVFEPINPSDELRAAAKKVHGGLTYNEKFCIGITCQVDLIEDPDNNY